MGATIARGSLLGVLALLAALIVGAAPARAHSDLLSSSPEAGATLAEAPGEISFTFTEELLDQGNAVTLTVVETDTRLELGAVKVRGDTVRVAWPDQSPAGAYRAAYRVVSADGHPINGSITFTIEQAVGGALGGDESESPTQTATETAAAPAQSPSPVVATPSPQPVSTDAADASGTMDAGVVVWALALGVVMLLGAGAGIWYMRRSR